MKRLLWLFLFALPLVAQPSNPSVRYVSGAPSGTCSPAPPIQVVDSTGTIYTCDNGTWAAQGGGGGGGNLSGTLTAGYVSVATAAHTLGDSSIDYGNTHANILTIQGSEPNGIDILASLDNGSPYDAQINVISGHGLLLENDITSSAGTNVTISNNDATGGVIVTNSGNGGTSITDSGGGGVAIQNSGSSGGITLTDNALGMSLTAGGASTNGIGLTNNGPTGVIQLFNSGSGGTIITDNGGGGINLTAAGGGVVKIPNAILGTTAEYSNGTCTTAATIAPANGNRQNVTLTNGDTCALTFTQPSIGTASITLKVIQSSTSTFNGTISGCLWPGGTVPTITATSAAVDFVSIYLDGTNAYCAALQNFM